MRPAGMTLLGCDLLVCGDKARQRIAKAFGGELGELGGLTRFDRVG